MFARRRWSRRRVPPQSTRCAQWQFHAAREECDGSGLKNGRSPTQHTLCEACDIDGRSEQSSVAAHAARYIGVIVINFALNHTTAKRAIVCCWRYRRLRFRRRIETSARHAEWSEGFLAHKCVDWRACKPL